MATESIGVLIPTAIPGYADAADIQAALRAYHYGSYSYDPANTSPGSLVSPSIAKTIYDIEQDIVALENRPSSGGEVNATQPVPGDFTPAGIPDGFIWVDSDGTIGGAPTSATSIFTNSAPTSSLTTGLIWVDKDAASITANPFIPQAIIAGKGDLVVGTANDVAGVLSVASTNSFGLVVNSSTTSGLEWTDLSTRTETLLNKTANNIILAGPEERWSVAATATTGTVNLDVLTSGILYHTSNATGNWTLNIRGSATTSLNNILTTNDSITVVFFATNGATPFYQTGFTIDGSSVVPRWQNATAPTSGNANSIDIYSYTIVKTGNAAFTAFGSQTRFA